MKAYLILVLLFWGYTLHAQENAKPKDSAKLYRKIEKYSNKAKFTKFIHKFIFEPVAKEKIKKHSFHKQQPQPVYTKYEGKIIRNIAITTLDPFDFSVTDTTQKPTRFLPKLGNIAHIKSKNLSIMNLLLIKKDKPLDSLLLKESERLIRSQRYVRRVYTTTKLVAEDSDSVDVYIRVLDSWSFIPDFSTSTSKSNFYIKERNFFGLGHELSASYSESLISTQSAFRTSYTVPTILNTFITTTLSYDIDLDGNYLKFCNVQRPFYSVYAKWGGGVYFDQQLAKSLAPPDPTNPSQGQPTKFNSQDYWIGRSFRILKGNSEFNRATNLVTSLRYNYKKFVEHPVVLQDSLGTFSDEYLYLAGIGLSSRRYHQDKYIFNFDVTEDVASGFVYAVTGGYFKKNGVYKLYSGFQLAQGSYFGFGYLSGLVEYGTFYSGNKSVQSVWNFKLTYFTNLLETGKWKFRQFIKPQLTIGLNRAPSTGDRLTLNGANGIPGFNGDLYYGTKKLLVTLQSQSYSPWRVVGFRLNPYFTYTLGMLAQPDMGFGHSKVYSQIGVGVIVSNDYLVFNSFQFSFSYYPTNLMEGPSNYKTNAIRTGDFNLQNFEFSKPSAVSYQ